MILDEIVAASKRDLPNTKNRVPIAELERLITKQQKPLNMVSVLRGDRVKLIAEVKQASPSKGLICRNFYPEKIAGIYADNGASAISILTETNYFKGNIEYLKNIRRTVGAAIPLLRKDFIYDPYQIYESRANGADALLLIVAILDFEQLNDLQHIARELSMQCLVEIHSKSELETALKCNPDMIGINNRDLTTFEVDLATTGKLKPLIPQDIIVISESGIKSSDDIKKMKQLNIDAVLIGESLMTADNIAAKMKEFL